MMDRRTFFKRGFGALALGYMARRGWHRAAGAGVLPGAPCLDGGALPLGSTRPFAQIPFKPQSEFVSGLPFAPGWTGDFYANNAIPFHSCENCFSSGSPPKPTEDIDVAIIGGGLSGLSTAYMLRDYNTVLFELRPRFGGVAQGEVWGNIPYSLGTAYLITPDRGSFLEDFYTQLGLPDLVRVADENDLIELNGQILTDFWNTGGTQYDQAAYALYAQVVTQMAEVDYPEIPLPIGGDNQWILDLDQKTLRQDIEDQMGIPVPGDLAAAIQAYCFSSFGAGWDQISAASGWNFLAAEEYGRWVFPGGITQLVDALWQRLAPALTVQPGCPSHRMRAGCNVVDVRLAPNDRVQVTYRDAQGAMSSLTAKRVVMANAKMIAKYMLPELQQLDPAKYDAMVAVHYNAYVVANVLLNEPIDLDFYDVFLLARDNWPLDGLGIEEFSRVTDMLSGHYAADPTIPRSVLTLYWPLPFPTGRFTLIHDQAWRDYAEQLVPQVQRMLGLLNVPASAVRQIRMTRWGHAMPVAQVGMIANGTMDHLRRPFEGRVYFINQDNWMLPAVENCLLDAEIFVPEIAAAL